MFAVLVEVAIDAGRSAESEAMLEQVVVPAVKAQPGFVCGYWFQSDDGRTGNSVAIFENEETARAAVTNTVGPPDGAGVKITRMEPMRVLAQA